MKFKTNAIIGLIFLGLLGFVYFYEIKGGEQRRQEAEKSQQLLDFKDTEVQRIELVRGDTTVVLDKGTDGWRLSAPVSDGASQDAVERYLRNLGESEREKTVVDSASATASQAAKYGLDITMLFGKLTGTIHIIEHAGVTLEIQIHIFLGFLTANM